MKEPKVEVNDQVPVFKSWNSWYLLTILLLVIQVVLYFLITKFFE